eukprot:scaffold2767_cov177-Amphora_coffeaeformis.AAC.70
MNMNMFRDSLFAVFRRRNSARNLNKVKEEKEKDIPEEMQEAEEEVQLEVSPESMEKKEREDETPLESPSMICFCEKVKEETKEELDLVEEDDDPQLEGRVLSHDNPETIEERFAYSLKANPIFEEGYSDCESQLNEGCEESAALKDDALLFVEDNNEKPKYPKVWTSRSTVGLGWTPGRVRRVENKNRFVLEPVVALTDALDDICLDENLIRAMSGKRGSFSSEISARTDESEGSEAKRVRMWPVFRARGGGAPS